MKWPLNSRSRYHFLFFSSQGNFLATLTSLVVDQDYCLIVDLECPVCGTARESVRHCLLFCEIARAVWLGSPLSIRVSEFQVDSFATFFDCMSCNLEKEQLELLCILCWKLWSCRNGVLWSGKHTSPQQIVEHSIIFLREYKRLILSKGRGAALVQRRSETSWKPPDAGIVKINVDGAISVQDCAYGMGAVARDHHGEVLAAMACKGQGAVAAEIAEACSLRKALQWANDLSFRHILLETDCVSLVTAINNEFFTMNSSLGAILLDCRMLMASFVQCQVKHIRREGNAVAHELAKRALQAEPDEYWIEEVPANIAPFVTGDQNQ